MRKLIEAVEPGRIRITISDDRGVSVVDEMTDEEAESWGREIVAFVRQRAATQKRLDAISYPI